MLSPYFQDSEYTIPLHYIDEISIEGTNNIKLLMEPDRINELFYPVLPPLCPQNHMLLSYVENAEEFVEAVKEKRKVNKVLNELTANLQSSA